MILRLKISFGKSELVPLRYAVNVDDLAGTVRSKIANLLINYLGPSLPLKTGFEDRTMWDLESPDFGSG